MDHERVTMDWDQAQGGAPMGAPPREAAGGEAGYPFFAKSSMKDASASTHSGCTAL